MLRGKKPTFFASARVGAFSRRTKQLRVSKRHPADRSSVPRTRDSLMPFRFKSERTIKPISASDEDTRIRCKRPAIAPCSSGDHTISPIPARLHGNVAGDGVVVPVDVIGILL